MPISLDEVLTLAKGTHALTEEQMVRILKAAPKMTPADLENLHEVLLQIRKKEMASMKEKIAVYHQIGSAHREWVADKARIKLTEEESASKSKEAPLLNTLLTDL